MREKERVVRLDEQNNLHDRLQVQNRRKKKGETASFK